MWHLLHDCLYAIDTGGGKEAILGNSGRKSPLTGPGPGVYLGGGGRSRSHGPCIEGVLARPSANVGRLWLRQFARDCE